jgi:membrane protease YdiL (CAAX protease family)
VLACLAMLIALLQKKLPSDIVGRWRWTTFLAGAGFWAAVQIAMTLLDYLLSPRGFRITVAAATAPLALYALFGLAVQTFTEDFLFRGYLTQAFLLATRRPLAAALISGSLFGALHISNGVPQAISALFFGILCSLIAIHANGIAFPFGLHLANNYFGAVIVVSADDVFQGMPGVIAQKTPQFVWSDVGLTIAALLAALWLAGIVAGRGQLAETGNIPRNAPQT